MKTLLCTLLLSTIPALCQDLPLQGTVNDLQYQISTQTVVLPFIHIALLSTNPKVTAFTVTVTFTDGSQPVTQTVAAAPATGIGYAWVIGDWSRVGRITFDELLVAETVTVGVHP